MKFRSKTISITGIGGFIGSRLAELALAKGYKVQGLESNQERAYQLQTKLKIPIILGSVTDLKSIQASIDGADVVVNTAAIVRESGDWNLFRKVNVEAPCNIAKELAKKRGKKFIHLSSVMVYGFDYVKNISEEGQLKGENNPYCTTKIESEAKLLSQKYENKLDLIILRPGDVTGPHSVPWLERILKLNRLGLFYLANGGKGTMNFTYVDNLCHAILLCIEKTPKSKVFNVTDDNPITWKEYFTTILTMDAQKAPRSLPDWMLRPIVRYSAPILSLLLKEDLVSEEGINFILRPHPVSTDRLKKELGFKVVVGKEEAYQKIKSYIESKKK